MIYDEIFGEIRVMDGGLGSLLSQMGHPIEFAPMPEIMQKTRRFLYSGATIIETCSYQAGLANLQEQLKISSGESKIYLKNSVALAQEAVADFMKDENPGYKIYIAGSIGSYGSNLHDRSEYTGSYIRKVDPTMLREYYEGQAAVLMEAGVDILVFETVPTLDDALIIAQLMISPKFKDFPFWISFYCKDNYSIGSNESFREVMKTLSRLDHVKVVGINCTDSRFIESLLKCDPVQKISVVNPKHRVQQTFE
uniref:Hcy-binding domain-containing protein n=1 Tax=Romanomermis culicivorax TaxID=13658 RepID=A0A915IH20_ROMCU